jgi:hypothetical protein
MMGGMSKKIDAARKELSKALKKHAEVVGADAVSLKKAQRASARVQTAAADYAAVVQAKSGMPSPFESLDATGLEASTIASLKAERNAIKTYEAGAGVIDCRTAPRVISSTNRC